MLTTSLQKKILARKRRHRRVRKKILGTPDRPRLSVFRSNKHIYAQIVDDVTRSTLASASSMSSPLQGKIKGGMNRLAAQEVGRLLAEKARQAGVAKVVFDRGGYLYHGRVRALAEAAREGGLVF